MVHVTLNQESKEVVAPEPQLPGQDCLLVGPQVEGRVGTSVLEVETPPVPCWFRKEGHHDWSTVHGAIQFPWNVFVFADLKTS